MNHQFRRLTAVLVLLLFLSGVFCVPAAAAVHSGMSSASAPSTVIPARGEGRTVAPVSSATWTKVGNNLRLKSSNGTFKKGFVEYDGKYYFFNSKGNLVTDFFKYKGKTYFGSLQTGAKGKGAILTGLVKIRKKYYYFNPSSDPWPGVMMTGFHKINGKRYYFDSKGRMKTGWFTVDGSKYYGSTSTNKKTVGSLATGTHLIGSTYYSFDSKGRLLGKSSSASASTSSGYLHMIDVSEHQGSINFKKVRDSGVKAVIIRAGHGKHNRSNTDKYFYEHIDGAKDAGLAVGIYWFSYAYTKQMAVNEANYCLRIIRKYNINLPVYFDWEYASMAYAEEKGVKSHDWRSRITDMTAAFCSTITKNGRRAGYYFNLDYLNRYYKPSKLAGYSTWYAIWGKNQPSSNIWNNAKKMSTPTKYDVWQFSSRGKIPGISGYVDCDLLLHPSILR